MLLYLQILGVIFVEKNKKFSLELTVKNDEVVETFDSLKQLQEMGYAGVDSTIVYKRSRVPAGYCTDFHNFIINLVENVNS